MCFIHYDYYLRVKKQASSKLHELNSLDRVFLFPLNSQNLATGSYNLDSALPMFVTGRGDGKIDTLRAKK